MIAPLILFAGVLTVGKGQAYARIEDAVAAAKPGDRIEVLAGNYPKTAVRITTPGLTIVAKGPVMIDGAGFDYSGVGAVPRAVFGVVADNVTIQGFEIRGAHNDSHNGAAVRIDAAKNVTVRDCDIHGNDMGIMSNGRAGDDQAGAGQLIERCHVHHNGDPGEPGQNHNLYLGGTSATIRFSEIDHSLTGHNLKSRAYLTRVEHSWIHDSANREMDFVDAWDTERAGADAVVVGSVVTKDPECAGNRGTIHFGQERGRRVGRLRLSNVTLDSPFSTPVISLSGDATSADLVDCVVRGKLPPGAPVTVRSGGASPAFRWMGKGKWAPTKEKFVGAG